MKLDKMARVQASDDRIAVRLPELFALFLSQQPKVNPHYGDVKGPAEEWISKFVMSLDGDLGGK